MEFAKAYQESANSDSSDLIQVVRLPNKNTKQLEDYIQVCNRNISFHATVKYGKGILQRLFDEYGERAKLAEKNEGVDWKALMHAVRVLSEAKELLSSGIITFPRPERELLLTVRKGELPYRKISDWIESGLVEMEALVLKSQLPKKPDLQYAEDLVLKAYRSRVCL